MMQHTEIIGKLDEFGLGISKNWLLDKDSCIDDYITFFNILHNSKSKGNNVEFKFKGYENEHRNLFEIPEIKVFFKTIFNDNLHYFYYLSNNNTKSLELAFLSLAKDDINYDLIDLYRLIMQEVFIYSIYQGDSPKDRVKHQIRISSAITTALVNREIIKGGI